MRVISTALVFLLAGCFMASAAAERIGHFEGKSAGTLAEAIANFTEANRQLEKLLGGKLADADIAAVHELTYTLEVALAKINEETGALADVLEEVHLASESADRAAVKAHGEVYLGVTRELRKLGR